MNTIAGKDGRADDGLAQTAVAQGLASAHAAWVAGDRAQANALLHALAAREPTAAAVWARLGGYALESNDNEAARAHLERAVAQTPDDAAGWTNLGTARLRLGSIDDAIAAYRRALALDPRRIGARVNLANALQQIGDLDVAVAELEAALELQPDAVEILNNLGNLYKDQGRLGDALGAYEAAQRADPQFRPAFSNLLAATKLSPRHTPVAAFALHRAFAERFELRWQAHYVPPANDADPDRTLRIGYVSPDCHTALPAFIEPVLRSHERARFKIFAYFNNAQPESVCARLGPIEARVTKGATDDVVAQWVRDDRIDILIDIAGHTGHNRLGVFGRKPAPVQITWLDYLGTTGLDSVDYRLTDAVADPPGASDALHSETLLRLEATQWCWNPPSEPRAPAPLPALAAGHLTLGSFNNCAKLTDETLALWGRVLRELPSARLVVVGVAPGFAQARVRNALGARVELVPRLSAEAFRRAIADVDIALDPVPFSGATTTLEALWQGVPVVTRVGATSASRSSASILTTVGLADWIAADDHAYVAIVRRAVDSIAALGALRSGLPQRLQRSALCDALRFTRGLERVLRDTWTTWCDARRTVGASDGALPRGARSASALPAPAQHRLEADARLAALDCALQAGRGVEVVDDARALVDDEPGWHAAHRAYLQVLLEWARTQPGLVARVFPPPAAPAHTPKVSVIVCSIDANRFRRVSAAYQRRFGGRPLQIIGVHDARSLAEAYNRAAERASGDVLIFSHDDIDLVGSDFAPRLIAHLDRYDGVGVAGASRVSAPRWTDAGQRAIHGHILHPAPAGRRGVLLMALGFQQPVCENIRVLDGAFIAVHRHVWEAQRFDADRFDGFHLYDLDFTWRASGAGARLAVAADLLLFHASLGKYDDVWRRYARRFIASAGLDPLHPPRPGGLQTRLETAEQLDALRAAMVHFRYGAPVMRAQAQRD